MTYQRSRRSALTGAAAIVMTATLPAAQSEVANAVCGDSELIDLVQELNGSEEHGAVIGSLLQDVEQMLTGAEG